MRGISSFSLSFTAFEAEIGLQRWKLSCRQSLDIFVITLCNRGTAVLVRSFSHYDAAGSSGIISENMVLY